MSIATFEGKCKLRASTRSAKLWAKSSWPSTRSAIMSACIAQAGFQPRTARVQQVMYHFATTRGFEGLSVKSKGPGTPEHEALRCGVPHARVGQFSIGDPGSVLDRRQHASRALSD